MLKEGVIKPSTNSCSSSVVLARKKDGSYRFCIDYRKLNTVIEKDAYPLPQVNATLDKLMAAKNFVVITDHQSLLWLERINNPSGRFARCAIELSQLNYEVRYRKASENALADALSKECCEVAAINTMHLVQRKKRGSIK